MFDQCGWLINAGSLLNVVEVLLFCFLDISEVLLLHKMKSQVGCCCFVCGMSLPLSGMKSKNRPVSVPAMPAFPAILPSHGM